jgi:hypothetical protein
MGGEQEFSATAVATVIPPADEETTTESDN